MKMKAVLLNYNILMVKNSMNYKMVGNIAKNESVNGSWCKAAVY